MPLPHCSPFPLAPIARRTPRLCMAPAIALSGGQAVPAFGNADVALHADPLFVQTADLVLGDGEAEFGRHLVPDGSLFRIGVDAAAVRIAIGDLEQGQRVPRLGRLAQRCGTGLEGHRDQWLLQRLRRNPSGPYPSRRRSRLCRERGWRSPAGSSGRGRLQPP